MEHYIWSAFKANICEVPDDFLAGKWIPGVPALNTARKHFIVTVQTAYYLFGVNFMFNNALGYIIR